MSNDNIILGMLVQEAYEHIMHNYGTVRNKCSEGATYFVYLARKAGFKDGRIQRESGLYGRYDQHNWAIDKKTGTIYDPTAKQFRSLGGASIVVDKKSGNFRMYTPITEEDQKMFFSYGDRMANAEAYWNYIQNKQREARNFFGEFKSEFRVDKNQKEYMYCSFKVEFNPWDNYGSEIRSALIWPSKSGGYNVRALMLHRIQRRDGSIGHFTKPVFLHIKRSKSGRLIPLLNTEKGLKLDWRLYDSPLGGYLYEFENRIRPDYTVKEIFPPISRPYVREERIEDPF